MVSYPKKKKKSLPRMMSRNLPGIFSPRRFSLRSYIYVFKSFELMLCMVQDKDPIPLFSCTYSVFPAQFVKETTFSPMCIFSALEV